MKHVRDRERDGRGDARDQGDSAKPGSHAHVPMGHVASTRRNRNFFALFKAMLGQTRGHNRMLALSLAASSIATLLGLVPLYGTKLIFDNVLAENPLPVQLPSWISVPTDRKALLLTVAGAMVAFALLSLILHIWSRWHATRITKRVQMDVRRRLFKHAIRLPLHRVYEIKSGGVASTLREDAGAVGDLVFAMLYNPWRAIIQLVGSLAILAWTDWLFITQDRPNPL